MKRRAVDPYDPKAWAPRRSPRGGNPAFGGVELEPGTLWLRERWKEAVESGETTLGWAAWSREAGMVNVANHGWDDVRPGRSTLRLLSQVERPFEESTSPGAVRDLIATPIVPVEGSRRRRPLRRRHRRRLPGAAKGAA